MTHNTENELADIAAEHNPAANRLLSLWAERVEAWRPTLGYPSRSAGLSTGGGSGDDAFEHLCEQADGFAARTVEGIVDNMPLPLRSVLMHVYLRSVFRYARVHDPAVVLREALDHFWGVAQSKGLS